MKRLLVLLSAGLLLLAIAAPAVAAPEKNWHMLTYEIACPNGVETTVYGSSKPGWEVGPGAATTPAQFQGAPRVILWIAGESYDIGALEPPPGLAATGKLVLCEAEMLYGSQDTYLEVFPEGAWFHFPRPWE